jgi:hypothetical protein
MADSLWHDHDLRYTAEDLSRAQRLRFDDFPAGLFLAKQEGEYFYAKPPLYAVVAAPFLVLFGVRGLLALNGLLLVALVLLGADVLARRIGRRAGLAASAVVMGFSATPAYLHWIDPFLLYTTLVAAALAAWRRERPVVCAAALALLACGRAPYGTLLAAPIVLYAGERRWRELATFGTAALLVAAAVVVLGRLALGQWSPYTGERYWYPSVVPFATWRTDGLGFAYSKAALLSGWQWPGFGDFGAGAASFVFGRFSGLLPYFPTFFACALWLRRGDREKAAWLGCAVASCVALQLALPHNPFGGMHALGNRLFVLLPVALVLVDVVAWIPWRAALTAPLLVLAVPLMQAPVYFSVNAGRQMLEPPYRWFPLEWRQAPAVAFPYSFPGLQALTRNQFEWEPSTGGVWTVGGTRAEFVLIRPTPGPTVVELASLLPAARVSDGASTREIRFSPGRTETFTLTPRAVSRDEGDGFSDRWVFHLTVETERGVTPAASHGSDDPRYLGVFVRPFGGDVAGGAPAVVPVPVGG